MCYYFYDTPLLYNDLIKNCIVLCTRAAMTGLSRVLNTMDIQKILGSYTLSRVEHTPLVAGELLIL